MTSLIVDTANIVNTSELRKHLSSFIEKIKLDDSYFVIMENGKIVSVMVSPDFLSTITRNKKQINLEEIRENNWNRNQSEIENGFNKLKKLTTNTLPKLFR